MSEGPTSAAEATAGEASTDASPDTPQEPQGGEWSFAEGEVSEASQGFIENKGWKSLDSVIESYQNLESLRGVPEDQLVRMPGEDDLAGVNEFLGKLGRPESPDGYELPKEDPSNPSAFADGPELREIFHKRGIPQNMAAGLFEDVNALVDNLFQAQQAEAAERSKTEMAEQMSQWGETADQQLGVLRSFHEKFGMTTDEVSAIEGAIGTKRYLELFHKVGMNFVQGELPGARTQGDTGPGGFQPTPAGAKDRIKQLMRDADFMEARKDMSSPEFKLWDQLHRIAASEGGGDALIQQQVDSLNRG